MICISNKTFSSTVDAFNFYRTLKTETTIYYYNTIITVEELKQLAVNEKLNNWKN